MFRSSSLVLTKIVAGVKTPDTGKNVEIRNLAGVNIVSASEAPIGTGIYIAPFTAVDDWGFWYINGAIQPAYSDNSPFYLGPFDRIYVNTLNVTSSATISSSLIVSGSSSPAFSVIGGGFSSFGKSSANAMIDVSGSAIITGSLTTSSSVWLGKQFQPSSITPTITIGRLGGVADVGFHKLLMIRESVEWLGNGDGFYLAFLSTEITSSTTSFMTGLHCQVLGRADCGPLEGIAGISVMTQAGTTSRLTGLFANAGSSHASGIVNIIDSINIWSRTSFNANTFVTNSHGLLVDTTQNQSFGAGSQISNYFGVKVVPNAVNGTVNSSYGLFIDNFDTIGNTLNKYGVWQIDPNAHNLFSGSLFVSGAFTSSIARFGNGADTATVDATVIITGSVNINNGSLFNEQIAFGISASNVVPVLAISNTTANYNIGTGSLISFYSNADTEGGPGAAPYNVAAIGGVTETANPFDEVGGALVFYSMQSGSITREVARFNHDGHLTASGDIRAGASRRFKVNDSPGGSGVVSFVDANAHIHAVTITGGIITSWKTGSAEQLSFTT